MNVNKVNLLKDNIVLASSEVKYYIFDPSVVELIKEVDRPDDYYFPGDTISFTIRVKNNGNKILRKIKINDVLDDVIVPIKESFEVITNNGEYIVADNVINVVNITLDKNEEAIITIKGKIKENLNDKLNIIK